MALRAGWAPTLSLALALGCQTDLGADLDEEAAAEMVLALDEAGIAAERAPDEDRRRRGARYRVRVARGDVARALAVLRDHRLPRADEPGNAALFERGGLIPSAAEDRARREAALGTELGRSLEGLDGVVRARVHVALADPASRPLDDAPPRARASVLLTRRRGASIDEEAARRLVVGAIGELDEADLTLVLTDVDARPRESPDLVWVGPVAVTRSTAGALKAVLAGSFALNLVLVVVLVLVRRHRP